MKHLPRTYVEVMEEHLSSERQMLFLVGPRQVGKTTTSEIVSIPRPKHYYYNWDDDKDQALIRQGGSHLAEALGLDQFSEEQPLIVFDEIHKYRKWKNFIKGFFDKYGKKCQIIVTGSAWLDVYKVGGDSLMGRYFLYRLHPLSVAELLRSPLRETELAPQAQKLPQTDFEALFDFGGFPEPYLRRNKQMHTRWKRLRTQQLFEDDMRDLTRIHEIGEIRHLAEVLKTTVGQTTSLSTLAKSVGVSVDTVKRWIKTLRSFYYCFTLQPWSKNISRSLRKEPKCYLWDWAYIEDRGAKIENFIASHLLKAVHFWTDQGLGTYNLHFLRDKEKREVDFLITKDDKPMILVEAKASDTTLSKSLYHFWEQTRAPHAFQVVFDLPFEKGDCFSVSSPTVVPASTFLSQLV